MNRYTYIDFKNDEYIGITYAENQIEADQKINQKFGIQIKSMPRVECNVELDVLHDNETIAKDILDTSFFIQTRETIEKFLGMNNELLFRQEISRNYAFGIPSPEAITAIAKHSPILEVGAGTGYWSYLLNKVGCCVCATDVAVGQNGWHQKIGKFFPIRQIKGDAAVKMILDYTVLMVWPTDQSDFAYEVAEAMAPGQKLIIVHEGPSGCVANKKFFDYLSNDFVSIDKTYSLPNYLWIHDVLEFYQKK